MLNAGGHFLAREARNALFLVAAGFDEFITTLACVDCELPRPVYPFAVFHVVLGHELHLTTKNALRQKSQ